MTFSPIQLAFRYLNHRIQARSIFWIHSPFVFAFYNKVLKTSPAAQQNGEKTETLRKQLAHSRQVLTFPDFGAGHGNRAQAEATRTVSDLARTGARRRREGELLYRLVAFLQPQFALEMGTQLGISALHQVAAMPPGSRFVTLEGAPAVAALARQHLSHTPAEIVEGPFEATLSNVLAQGKPDYVLVDGNHRYEATLRYFHALLPRVEDGACLVFDDINWSADMNHAWQEICQHPEATVTLDLFWLGIVFVRRPQVKEHFVVAY